MDGAVEKSDVLLRLAASRLRGVEHRLWIAEVTEAWCDGHPRWAERRFGWGRETIRKGQREWQSGLRCVENFVARVRPRWEAANPQRASDIRDIVEDRTNRDDKVTVVTSDLEVARHARAMGATVSLSDLLGVTGQRLSVSPGSPLQRCCGGDHHVRCRTSVCYIVSANPSVECDALLAKSVYTGFGRSTKVAGGRTDAVPLHSKFLNAFNSTRDEVKVFSDGFHLEVP